VTIIFQNPQIGFRNLQIDLWFLQNLLFSLRTFITENSPTSTKCRRIASEVYYIHCKLVDDDVRLCYSLPQLAAAVVFAIAVAISTAAIATAATAAVSYLAASFS
jgi:hypothetical protein